MWHGFDETKNDKKNLQLVEEIKFYRFYDEIFSIFFFIY